MLNYAKNGATLDSLSEKLDELVKLKPDYVLIQFGHNDMKQYDSSAYRNKLISYVDRIKKAGGKPVMLSSVTRRNFDENGKIKPRFWGDDPKRSLPVFGKAAQAVAKEFNLPFIDLYAISVQHHNRIGAAASTAYNYNKDDTTHFSKEDARAIADLIVAELRRVVPELSGNLVCATPTKSELVQSLEGIFYDPDFAKIPDRSFKAADYGVNADGTTVSGALFVKSNVELRLDEGVVLQAVQDDAAFPDKWTRIAGIEMDWPAALINVYEQGNVRITGKGLIDGNGKYWWNKFWGDPRGKGGMMPSYNRRGLRWALDYDCKRVRPIVVYKSKDVLLRGFTVKRAGFWTITFTFSDRVHADGITIRNNIGGHGPSTDGINTDSSRNVLIENCDVDCNDDNFCLKAGRDSDGLRVNLPTENVVIRNCKTGRGYGLITLGSETSGGINNVEICNMKANGTVNGFYIKSAKVRGGVIRNIWIHDVELDRVPNPFHWDLNWFPAYSYPPRPKDIPESEWPAHWHVLLTKVEPPERGIPEFHNLRISNVKVTNAKTVFMANAYAEKPMRNITFENVTIEAKSAGRLTNCKDWTMKNVSIKANSKMKVKNSINIQQPKYELKKK